MDRAVGLYMTRTMNETTATPDGVFLLTNVGKSLVGLLCGCERKSLRTLEESRLLSGRTGWKLC